MIPARYPAPGAVHAFSDTLKFYNWRRITDSYAHHLIEDVAPDDQIEALHRAIEATTTPTPEMIGEYEQELGHDVVAFLAAYTSKLPDEVGPYIHRSMTSSDLVEFGLFQSLAQHSTIMSANVAKLISGGMSRWKEGKTIRAGRTHGQLSDHTTWGHQMHVQRETMREIRTALADFEIRSMVVKMPGPTGWPDANPDLVIRGARVADELNCYVSVATQVINRDLLLQWACLYLRLAAACENLALQVRLASRADVAEVREGARRIGSSAMPHKYNPIDSEKVCGMARVARGCFTAISEDIALWEDRDLTNSSLERIAVPELAAVVEHMVATMSKVMDALIVDTNRMQANATDPRTFTNVMQVVAQDLFGLGPVEASALIRVGISKNPEFPGMWMDDIMETINDKEFDADAWMHEVNRRVRARF